MARRTMRSNETEQKIAEVRGALDQMRWVQAFHPGLSLTSRSRIADVSHPSKGAVKVMDFLLGAHCHTLPATHLTSH
jgi:hypothetical protein